MSCDFQDDEFTIYIYIYVYESGGQQQNHSIKVSKILRDFIYHFIQHQLLNRILPHRKPREELARWCPGCPVYIYHGSPGHRLRALKAVLRRGGVLLAIPFQRT